MEGVLSKLQSRETHLAVLGLGYVGFPLAMAFAKNFSVIGIDNDEEKVAICRREYNVTGSGEMEFTTDPCRISAAKCIIIAVPTPIYGDKRPNLEPLKLATITVGKYLAKGSIVAYESTVYPGVTEEICIPLLERESGLSCGSDFKVGYSPERINPGDKIHRLENIVKIVSGIDNETLKELSAIYETVVDEIHPAPSIKVAEAAKLAENAQRDINVAFMNELATVFHLMDINTGEVIKAMDTKWNALGFRPGLVGGHCIGVDPYYFIYKAQNLGYYSQLISVGRRINNGMVSFVVKETIGLMIKNGINVSQAKVVLFGMTFKEDCPDTRNSRGIDIHRKLASYGISLLAVDPLPESGKFAKEHGIELTELTEVREADCLVFLVAHRQFRELDGKAIGNMFRHDKGQKRILIDVKRIFPAGILSEVGCVYWSL